MSSPRKGPAASRGACTDRCSSSGCRAPRPHWAIHELLEHGQERRIELAAELIHRAREEQVAHALRNHRPELKRFLDAVRARTSSRRTRLLDEVEKKPLLRAFPLWLSTLRDLHRVAPLEAELFDVVIVDEATQSDMASPLPALHRARRAVVTGDPRQLRHVCFLSRGRVARLAEEHALDPEMARRLDYREKSFLDLVDDRLASSRQVAFLDEHFRSMPQIIAFSNREFYGGALRVMTSRPETRATRAVALRRVAGRREPSGVNPAEADAVVDELERRVDEDRRLGRARSLGVLSPFRKQVDRIASLVTERFPLEVIERHSLRVGTSHGFQGDERDVMLLSLAVDDDCHPASVRFLSQPRRLQRRHHARPRGAGRLHLPVGRRPPSRRSPRPLSPGDRLLPCGAGRRGPSGPGAIPVRGHGAAGVARQAAHAGPRRGRHDDRPPGRGRRRGARHRPPRLSGSDGRRGRARALAGCSPAPD